MKGGSHEWFGHLTPDRFPSLISSSPLMRSAALRSRAVDLGGCGTGTLSRSQAQAETCGPRRDPPAAWRGVARAHLPSWSTFQSAPQAGGGLRPTSRCTRNLCWASQHGHEASVRDAVRGSRGLVT